MGPKWLPGGLLELLGLLKASWSGLGGLLESSWSGLGRSWGDFGTVSALGAVLGRLKGLEAKMLLFLCFYKGSAAQIGRHGRQQVSEPDPWRG